MQKKFKDYFFIEVVTYATGNYFWFNSPIAHKPSWGARSVYEA